jgi:hypothetical protein
VHQPERAETSGSKECQRLNLFFGMVIKLLGSLREVQSTPAPSSRLWQQVEDF